jgi:hypothetical protein
MSEAKSRDPFAEFQTIHLKKIFQMAKQSMDSLYKVPTTPN